VVSVQSAPWGRAWITILIALLGTVASLPSSSRASHHENGAVASDLEEQVLVRRIRWPVLIEAREPGACDGLVASMVHVTEDGGPPLPVDEVERERMPTIHAILIDISGSHMEELEAARETALAYVNEVRHDDEVMVALFDESLSLLAAPTANRSVLRERLRHSPLILPAGYTALWDSLHDLVRYLRGRPERKVVILLTDGCENRSMMSQITGGSPRPLQHAMDATENLIMFAIGIDTPSRCEGESRDWDPRHFFQQLAGSTGGSYFTVRYQGQESMFGIRLGKIFDDIRRRLDREGFILYRPRPYGQGPKDEPSLYPHRWRRVKVRLRMNRDEPGSGLTGCRVTSAGPRSRLEGVHPGGLTSLAVLPTGDGGYLDRGPMRSALRGDPPEIPHPELWLAACREEWEQADMPPRRVRDPRCPAPDVSRLMLDQDEIRTSILDVAAERGALYEVSPGKEAGKHRHSSDRKARWMRREVTLAVPPFSLLKQEIHAPELALLWLMEHGRRPTVIHGSTFLQIRDYLGQALYAYPGYRDFALDRIRRRHLDSFSDLRRYLDREVDPDDTAGRERIDAWLHQLAERVRPDEPQGLLAEWLGDLSAYELSARLEGLAGNLLLRGPAGKSRAAYEEQNRHLVDLIADHWNDLRCWFPLATQFRIGTPLVPVFDPERDVVGFYRVQLPGPYFNQYPPPNRIPEEPLGLRTIQRVLQIPGLTQMLEGKVRIANLGQEDVPGYARQKLRQEYCRVARRDPLLRRTCDQFATVERQVTLDLILIDAPDAEAELTAFFAALSPHPEKNGGTAPICMELTLRSADATPTSAPYRMLGGRLAEEGLLCSPVSP
jgi:Mg-chelatase subunit ChlD